MEAKIVSVKENPLLDRREAEVEVNHEEEATPSKEDVADRIAAENGLNTDEIDVDHIYTGYGQNQSKAFLKIHQQFDYDEELEEDTIEEEEEQADSQATEEYAEIVSGTITEAKNQLKDLEEPDFKAALNAEKNDKDRKTLKQWLENQIEG
jgi:ribosomal protein S24E